jgi:hypothetical protein
MESLEVMVWVLLAIPVLMGIVLFWLAFEPIFGSGVVLIAIVLFGAVIGFSLSIFAAILLIGLAAILGGIVSS